MCVCEKETQRERERDRGEWTQIYTQTKPLERTIHLRDGLLVAVAGITIDLVNVASMDC